MNEMNLEKPAGAQLQMATVRYSVYGKPDPKYVGMTIDEVRQMEGGVWGIPSDAVPYKGKTQLQGDYKIQPTDHIEFSRRQGEKG